MTIVDIIDRVTKWAEEEICTKVKLKLPADDHADASYNQEYKLVTPAAFPLYVPTKDRMPPQATAPIPSLCIQLVSGRDQLVKSSGAMKLRFCFSTWDPGTHGLDIFKPIPDTSPQEYQQWNTEEAMAYYMRRSDGWRNVWNWVDVALRALESTEYIAGYRIIKEEAIDYGPVEEQDSIPDYYPYWFAWISFTIQYGIARIPSYQELL